MCKPEREIDHGHPDKTLERVIMIESSDRMKDFMAYESLLFLRHGAFLTPISSIGTSNATFTFFWGGGWNHEDLPKTRDSRRVDTGEPKHYNP